jgi:diacylglycerol kinase (ATP)
MLHVLTPLFKAFQYSKQGIIKANQTERALKQEFKVLLSLIVLNICSLIMIPSFSILMALTILIAWLFVIVIELLNTAIEKVADTITLEHHPMIGYAKDLGSAAVLIALMIFFLIVSYVIYMVVKGL